MTLLAAAATAAMAVVGIANQTFTLSEFYNGSQPGPGCGREPVCRYKGVPGGCAAATDGGCTDVKVTCNRTGIFYHRFYDTRDGSCQGPSFGPFGGAADGTCQASGDALPGHHNWFVIGTCEPPHLLSDDIATAEIAPPPPPPLATSAEAAVTKVHVLFSHHLDVGLDIGLKLTEDCVGFATKIVQRYFDEFIPRAIKLAQQVRAKGKGDRFAYTMHPWVLSLYVDCDPWSIEDGCPLNEGTLRCPSQAQVSEFDQAVKRGDILWAASPMNLNPSAVGSPDLFTELLSVSESLNRRYNLSKAARVWSNVDVPGFVRSTVPLLSRAGVKFLSIGANARSAWPNGSYPINYGSSPWQTVGNNFSTMFRWRDRATAEEIVVMYHRSYGSNFKLSGGGGLFPNTTLISQASGSALASYFRSDNTGPPDTVAEVESIFASVRRQFPQATQVFGSTMDAFAAEVTEADIAAMPLLEHEWGDQWLGGLQTDPWRIQVYREMVRLREQCLESGECASNSTALRNMTRWLSKISEHTQGVQSEGWSPGVPGCTRPDGSFQSPCTVVTDKHWSNQAFAAIHNSQRNLFTGADLSWLEARKFNDLALGALDAQAGHDAGAAGLARKIRGQLPLLRPRRASTAGMRKATALTELLHCGGIELGFAGESGAISHLRFGGTGSSAPWADRGALLMDLRYMTYNDRENLTCATNATQHCPNPVPGSWSPTFTSLHHNCSSAPAGQAPAAATAAAACASCRVVVESGFNATLNGGKYGSPRTAVTEYMLHPGTRSIEVSLSLWNKTTTRLPESMVLLFQPQNVKKKPPPLPTGRQIQQQQQQQQQEEEEEEGTLATTTAALSAAGSHRSSYGWAMDVLGGWVDPYDVLSGGNQYQHGIWSGVKYADNQGQGEAGLYVDSLDAAMACPLVAQWNFSTKETGCPAGEDCGLLGDGSEHPCDTQGLNGHGGQQQLNRTAGCPTAHVCRVYGVGGMALQLHANRMGISGFAQWYPFGIQGDGGAHERKTGSGGPYQQADENMLFRFKLSERG